MFNPSTLKMFASRDVIIHEKLNEGNKDKSYEEQCIPLLINDNNDEAKDNHLHQQQQQKEKPNDVDTFSSRSLFRGEQEIKRDIIQASPLPWRSIR